MIDPEFISNKWDYICFTDINFKSKIWQIKKVDRTLKDSKRENGLYKILPHKFLSEYDYSIYIDGNMKIRADIDELVYKYLLNSNIAFMNHKYTKNDSRSCLYDEADAIINMSDRNYKDDPEIILNQIRKYKNNNYPINNGLICGGIILRKHNENDVVKAMKIWWEEVQNGSKRDQLSFNYSAWKTNLYFTWIEGNVRENKYFKIISKHKVQKNNLFSRFKFFFKIKKK